MIPSTCKRLIEVDFPIAAVSAHSAREKSIRHGHPSTLHLWWARRPLAACRSVLLGLLLPDPCDLDCPVEFKSRARELLAKRYGIVSKSDAELRELLLKFIGEFANWDHAANALYLEIGRGLVKAAHPEETPVVVDPFAGGGSIPLEALRLGCEVFASDLNPVACLILKTMLEDIPRYGNAEFRLKDDKGKEIVIHGLADALRHVGKQVKEAAEKELVQFYPLDPDGSRPIAYLWARTVRCEGIGCGAEIPLLRGFWILRKASQKLALRYTVRRVKGKAPTLSFELFTPKNESEVQKGTVVKANATCPCCNIVLPAQRVCAQLAAQRGGADTSFDKNGTRVGGAMLFTVVLVQPGSTKRTYRTPTAKDYEAVYAASKYMARLPEGTLPNEPLPPTGTLGLFSLPASPTEMTDELREWQDKLTKVVGRVGKDLVANDASEVSEIVRRRLFEEPGRESMRRAAARQFAAWVFSRRDRLPPEWGQLSEEQIRAQFEACYPFHPATLTVFQRKWRALAQFQETRSTLAMLGMWISCAYREGYGKARREPLLTLGSAPLADREFLSAVLRQMGEPRLQAAIHADIAAPSGQPKSHAESLDDEDAEGSGRTAIHQRVAKTLFFESCGGQANKAAHLPEMYFAVGDPDTETTLIHTAVQNLERRCYFLRPVGVDGWRFGHVPTLKKVHADRKQALDPEDVKRNMGELAKMVFKKENEIHLSLFPKDSTDVVDQAMLTMAVMRSDEGLEAEEESPLRQRITDWTRKCGQSSRQNPGGILWVTCEGSGALRTAVEELLAWQAVTDDANRGLLGDLEQDDIRRIQRELTTAKGQIEDRVWSSYNHLLLWDASVGKLKDIVLGQLHQSEAGSITSAILARLRHDSLLSREIGASYIERNWPPALKESGMWPLAGLKAAFFQGQFTRLEKADEALRTTVSRAVGQGLLGLASGKDATRFDRVWFKEPVEQADITFDYDTYLLTAAKAKSLKQSPLPAPVAPGAAGGTPEPLPPVASPQPSLLPGIPAGPIPPKSTSVVWEGELKREQWNLFSLKVLTRLAQSEDLEINVKVSAKLKEAQTLEQLNAALKELGINDQFRKD